MILDQPVTYRMLVVALIGSLAVMGCRDDPEEVDAGTDAGEDVSDQDAPDTGEEDPTAPIAFAEMGPRSGLDGLGSFTFGAATAATQIEDQNVRTDWHFWTLPTAEGGRGESEPIGDASFGFSRALEDVELLKDLNLDSYRFSVEWARVEPERGVIDEAALDHYDAFIDALVEAGIRPMITVHHFSNPVWVDDPRATDCADGPTDENLCGWDHPEGGPLIVEALEDHARRLAERFGDRVDEWCTLNEPVNYLLAGYGAGEFPPGKTLFFGGVDHFVAAVRHYLHAHAAIYDAIKEADTIDATGDGVAASVGFTLSVADWVPARGNAPSDHPEDIAAAERVRYVYHELFPEAVRRGAFDPDLDQSFSEEQPDWAAKLDWLGVQYYFRAGVTGEVQIIPLVDALVCFGGFDLGSCLPPEDPTHFIPEMGYEFYAPGLRDILVEFSGKWPDLPMTVSESGLATNVGERRAEHIVRSLEQIQEAILAGADVRGYYHWTLMDNFEWAEGYSPRFGLYFVDFATGERTPTLAVDVLAEIARSRELTRELRERYGGLGPMTPEE